MLSSCRAVLPSLRLAALFLLSLTVAAATASCGNDSEVPIDKGDQETTPDLGETAAAELGDFLPPKDQVGADEAVQEFVGEMDTADLCGKGAGCFGDPCAESVDCLSGLCLSHMGDKACSQTCIDECPQGWKCEQVAGLGPDLMFACVSPFPYLCRPCNASADCKTAYGQESVCIDYSAFGEGRGSFCGADCSSSGCPDGFSCGIAHTVEGGALMQCVAAGGDCFCSSEAVKLALSTSCRNTNEYGSCKGKRECQQGGLTMCSAKEPAAESCNGEDDDCDGSTDESVCDDKNACTTDTCNPKEGCQYTPLTGTDCNDGDVCTLADHCEAGVCVGTAINCNDDNPCTYDNCNPSGGCTYTFNSLECDDKDPCTVADTCSLGVCKGFKVPCDCTSDKDCLPLEDGNLCNGTLFCKKDQIPFQCAVDPKTLVVCPDPVGLGSECLSSVCDSTSGGCSMKPAAEGKSCSDGNACTFGELCKSGECTGGSAMNCNDGNSCTNDSCEASVGCLNTPNQMACDDGNACTVGDYCSQSQCVPGTVLSCDDASICTADSCDPKTGCNHTPVEGACDDLNDCTTQDKCVNGKCIGSGSLACDDGNQCTKDICLPDGGCLHENIAGACSDGDPCTLNDSCKDGVCLPGPPVNCNDSNPCTKDSCGPTGLCVHTPVAEQCSDGNECTTGDYCSNGLCVPGQPLKCDDDNVCTSDSCDSVLGCVFSVNTLACNDGNVCTTGDICQGGVCTGTAQLLCDDKNGCTDDTCDPKGGCIFAPNSAACDDKNLCTTDDLCVDGVCKGTGQLQCDDGNICTNDTCAPETGCVHLDNTAPCSDDDPCTMNDTCANGVCIPGQPMNCNDSNVCTADVCGPPGVCTHSPVDGSCDDLNPCTAADTCISGLCLGTKLTDCSDDNPCTDDSCNPLLGCIYTFNNAPCDDSSVCTTKDACDQGICKGSVPLKCDDGNDCTSDSCDPITGCLFEPREGECNDGNACTTVDLCTNGFCAGSAPLQCDDGDACTSDSCNPSAGCVFTPIVPCCGNGKIEPPEQCDDGGTAGGDGCASNCTLEPMASCKALLDKFSYLVDGIYTVDIDGAGGAEPFQVYCDMKSDGGGWTLVGVARVQNHGQAGWNNNSDLNPGNSTSLTAHWHFSKTRVNALAQADQFRCVCFESNNNYIRFWWGVSNYDWTTVTNAAESWDTVTKQGSSFATYWAPHHYGLVSGDNEVVTIITAHSGNEWACGGLAAPGGEGYTGRGGISNQRLWAR